MPGPLEATRRSLQREPKELPPVWLYDERGSLLYEAITRLPDYYLPRREAEILGAGGLDRRADGGAHAGRARLGERQEHAVPPGRARLERFVPFDVSERMLRTSADAIAEAYPEVSVEPIVGNFERDLAALPTEGPRLIALLGSTIGNLYPQHRAELLGSLARSCARTTRCARARPREGRRQARGCLPRPDRRDGGIRPKRPTAVNRELGATFEQRKFVYEPRWDPEHEWMDIGLRARGAHIVAVPELELRDRIPEGRAASCRDQLEVPAERARNGARAGGVERSLVVDRPGGRLRGRPRSLRKERA